MIIKDLFLYFYNHNRNVYNKFTTLLFLENHYIYVSQHCLSHQNYVKKI